jgi:hypothetical protein
VLADVHPVDHQRHRIQPGQIGGQQRGQRGLGRSHELARDRGLAVAVATCATPLPTGSSPTR